MQIDVDHPSTLRRKVTIELGPDEIKLETDRAYNELRKGVRLRGFRPGRAPRHLLERFFGDQVRGEVVQKLIKESTDKALAEKHLEPVAEPEIVTEESDFAKALRFSVSFDVRPELVVKDYEGLRVPAPHIEVTEQQVEAALEQLREDAATLSKLDDRTVVASGDFAMVEVAGFEGGKPIAGSKMERLVEISERALRHRLHELLIGAELGAPLHRTLSYPADYEEPELAGKNVEWRATVKEIFRRELAALDDEFARDQGEFQTLDELRDKLRADLMGRARAQADARVRQGLLDLVIERNPVEVPQSLIAREQRALEGELAAALEAGGMAREQAAERARLSAEELKARAERRARGTLIVDALAEQEKIEVGDDEVAERVAALVTQAGRARERVASLYAREENRAALRKSMRREKTLDLLLQRAQPDGPAHESPAEGS